MKLQDAYASESNTVGNWVSIGYIAPGATKASDATGSTTSFTYSGGNAKVTVTCPSGANTNTEGTACEKAEGQTTVTVPAESGSVDGWKATSLAKLNDCKGGSIWSVAAETVNGCC